MDIIIFQPYFKSKGGMERLILEYVKRSRYKINILTWLYDKRNTFDELQEIGIKEIGSLKRFFRKKLMRGVSALINSFLDLSLDCDIFLISSAGLSELILLRSKINSLKIVYSHTPLRYSSYDCIPFYLQRYKQKFALKTAIHVYNKLEKKAWKKINFAIFNSHLSRKRALNKKLIDIYKTKVIYPGADLENLYYDEPLDYFLYIARFGIAKRQDILIKAFSKFVKKYKGYRLVLAGGFEDKKYFTYLQRLIKDYKLQNEVKIFCNLPYQKILELYARSLAFIHIPFMEDFGIAPLEAAAAGKYIINVYPSGNYEILKDFPGVYWIKERFHDEKMIEEVYKSLEFFVKNQDELIELGKENRKLIKKLDLSWDRFAKEMDSTLEEIYELFTS